MTTVYSTAPQSAGPVHTRAEASPWAAPRSCRAVVQLQPSRLPSLYYPYTVVHSRR